MWEDGHNLLFRDGGDAGCKTLGSEAQLWGKKNNLEKSGRKGSHRNSNSSYGGGRGGADFRPLLFSSFLCFDDGEHT